jgi:serine protease Do
MRKLMKGKGGINNRSFWGVWIILYAILWILPSQFSWKKMPVAIAESISSIHEPPSSFSHLVRQTKDSIVNIRTVTVVRRDNTVYPFGSDEGIRDFFERFFQEQIPEESRRTNLGSGFIIDKQGLILTNNHLVENAIEIKVTLSNKKEFEGVIIGRDSKTDLALIDIQSDKPLFPLTLGDSDRLEVGDWVIAIGNPYGLDHTVTAGIVSAKYRHLNVGAYDNFIQTDAPINVGNSGGPLLNTKGDVVGINSSIYTDSGGSIGIGFAIPINMAKDLLPQLRKGEVIRGWIGVRIQNITNELKEKLGLQGIKGALVSDVTDEGPAKKAGLERGDVIISFNGNKIGEMEDLSYIVALTEVGRMVPVEVIRNGKRMTLQVKVDRREEDSVKESLPEKGSNIGMVVEEISSQTARRYGLTDETGLIVVQVQDNSLAYEAGIRRGDIILEMDREPVNDLKEYMEKMGQYKEGDTVLFLIKREGTTLYFTLKIRD